MYCLCIRKSYLLLLKIATFYVLRSLYIETTHPSSFVTDHPFLTSPHHCIPFFHPFLSSQLPFPTQRNTHSLFPTWHHTSTILFRLILHSSPATWIPLLLLLLSSFTSLRKHLSMSQTRILAVLTKAPRSPSVTMSLLSQKTLALSPLWWWTSLKPVNRSLRRWTTLRRWRKEEPEMDLPWLVTLNPR